MESELRPVSGGEAAEDGPGDVEEGEVEAEVGAGVHRHRALEPAEEGGRLGVHQDDFHLRQNTEALTNMVNGYTLYRDFESSKAKLRDWIAMQAGAGCYSRAAKSTKDLKAHQGPLGNFQGWGVS